MPFLLTHGLVGGIMLFPVRLQAKHCAAILRRPLGLAVVWLLLASPLMAQEALRISLAGDVAAETQKQVRNSVGYYNLLWGPVVLRCGAAMGAEFTDNVRNSSHAESDEVARPSANLQLNWPVTEWNTLNFSMDGGYSFYAQHSDLNQFYMNPGSGLSFDIFIKDWKINLHDRAAMTEYAYQNPTTGGGQNNTFLQNDAGISGLWDLNKMVVNLGFDHMDYIGVNNQSSQPDSASENFFLNAGFRFQPEIMVGLEGGLGLVRYAQASPTNVAVASDALQWNAGAFSSVQISEYLSARLDGGYTVYLPENSRLAGGGEMTSLYFQFSVSHRITEHIDYLLTAGHSVDFAYNGQPYERLFVRLNPNWNVLWKFSISTPVWWEQGTQVAANALHYNQYGAGFTVSRALSQKLSASVYYQFVMETTDQAQAGNNYNYTADIVGLNLSCQF